MTRGIGGSRRCRSGSGPRRPAWRWGAPRDGPGSGSSSPAMLCDPAPGHPWAARGGADLGVCGGDRGQRVPPADRRGVRGVRSDASTPAGSPRPRRGSGRPPAWSPRCCTPSTSSRRTPWAKKATDVTTWPEPHGMASLRIHAPAPVIGELWDTVNTEAWAQARAAKTQRGGARPDRGTPRRRPCSAGPAPTAEPSRTTSRRLGINPDAPRPRRRDRADRASRSPTGPTSTPSPSPPRRSSWSTSSRSPRPQRGSRRPARRQQAGVGQPARAPDRAGTEGPGRGDHRPRRPPRRQRRTRRVGGLRDHPRLDGPGARRGRLVAAGAPGTGRGVAAGLRAHEVPAHPQAPRPPARSRAGLPRAVLQRPTQADRPRHRLGRRRRPRPRTT